MEQKLVTKLYSDVGMDELFMARLFHFKDNILSGAFDIEETKKAQDELLGLIFDCLEPAFRSLRSLRVEWLNDKIPEKKKKQDIENIYTYSYRAFKDRFQTIAKILGYDIGFFFQKQSEFEKGCENFLKKYPKIDSDFITALKDNRLSWFNLMKAIRDVLIEHAAGKDPSLAKQLEKNMSLESAEIVFDNVWRMIEDLLAVFVHDKTSPKYGMTLLEIKEYQENKNHPQRFSWFIVNKK